MLSGARNYRNSQLCEKIYNRMKSLFRHDKQSLISGAILLSNTYSSLGQCDQAEDIRSYQKQQLGTKVKPGISWTEINGDLVVRYILWRKQKKKLLFFLRNSKLMVVNIHNQQKFTLNLSVWQPY